MTNEKTRNSCSRKSFKPILGNPGWKYRYAGRAIRRIRHFCKRGIRPRKRRKFISVPHGCDDVLISREPFGRSALQTHEWPQWCESSVEYPPNNRHQFVRYSASYSNVDGCLSSAHTSSSSMVVSGGTSLMHEELYDVICKLRRMDRVGFVDYILGNFPISQPRRRLYISQRSSSLESSIIPPLTTSYSMI